MSAKTRNFLTLLSPWIVAALAIVFLCLYDTGVIDIDIRHPVKLKEACVSSDTILYDPEDIPLSQNLLLVNREHPLPSDFEADIVFYRDTDVYMNSILTDDYGRMSDYIREYLGNRLYVSSTYRSFENQERVYNEEGPEVAALPGQSEHQTGLALDVYVMYFAGYGFIDSQVGRYVNDHCSEYGFIIRYPDGAEDITGFAYEPWHIRYVGQPHASIIAEYGLTLEEYIDAFELGKWYEYDGYVMARLPEDDIRVPADLTGCDITFSPDNTGYVFVTVAP